MSLCVCVSVCVCVCMRWDCACACVCFWVCPWASVYGLWQLGVPRFTAFSRCIYPNTHALTQIKPKHKHCGYFQQNNFLCIEPIWLPWLFFFLTADRTTRTTCLLDSGVPALSLWLCQWLRNRRSVQQYEGCWYPLCRFWHSDTNHHILNMKVWNENHERNESMWTSRAYNTSDLQATGREGSCEPALLVGLGS